MPRFAFGDYIVDTETIEVIGPDGVTEVEPQVFDVLRYLVEHGDRVVAKEELLDNVWGDRFVSESALTTRIKQARRAVGDDGTRQWAIKTVHGRGYRFVPPVSTAEPAAKPVVEALAGPQGDLPDELGTEAQRPFCGRRRELAQCLDVVRTGTGPGPYGWVWILGEPGIGKTRLAAEVARAAHAGGQAVLLGHNSEDLRVPFQPFIEVLRQALAAGIVDPAATPDALAPMLPGPEDRRAASSGWASATDDESQRYTMFEAVAESLAAATRPLVVIVDDLHWAADSTMQLLAHLQGRPDDAMVTFVVTARDTAPDDHPKVAGLLATAQGRDATAVIHLEGLTGEDAAQLLGREADVDLDAVLRETAGNPLFLQAVSPLEGTVDIERAVQRRLLTLDDGIQDSLRLASVLGLDFDLPVVAAATGRDELDLLEDLEAAVAARLLDDIGGDRFRFIHALVRSSLRSEIGASRRARLHGRIAVAYHDVFGDDPRHLPALAFHTAEAARADRSLCPLAVERLERAARESSAQFSFEEATDLLVRARALADEGDDALRAHLAVQQGIAESRAGRNMTAAHTFEEAVALAGATDDVGLQVEAALRYEDASWRPGLTGTVALTVLDRARVVLDDAVAAGAEVADELTLRSRLAVGRLRALAMTGRRDEVDAAYADAERLATEVGSPDLEALVLAVFVSHVTAFEDVLAAEPLVHRLAALASEVTDSDIALNALHVRIMFSILTGRVDEQRRLDQAMAELQERSHSRFWQFIWANQQAMEALYEGDLVAAEALAVDCRDLADRLPEEDGSGIFGLRMFMIRREQDRLAAMAPLVRRVVAESDGSPLWTPGLALLLAETGMADEAASVLGPVRAAGFELPYDAMWSTVMAFLAETVVHLGRRDDCAILRDRLGPLAGTNITTGSGLLCFGRADRYLGMLSLVLGEVDRAEEHLAAALEGDHAGGSVLWAAESRLWLSRARRAQGHPAEADAMVEVVRRDAEGAGLTRLVRLATAEG